MSTQYRADIDLEGALWTVYPCGYQDGTDDENAIVYGPFATAEEAHKFAEQRIAGVDYELQRIVSPALGGTQ